MKNQYKFSLNIIPKEDSQCICLSALLIDSVYRKYKNYYPQTIFRKYVAKGKRTCTFIIYDTEIFSDVSNTKDSDKEDSDEES